MKRTEYERKFEKLHYRKQKRVHKLEQLEKKILDFSGLSLEKNEIQIFDVPLYDDQNNYIHTIACGDVKNPPLLMVHGYAGAAVYFYLCFKELAKKFRVYAIDFIGHGASKRSKFDITGTKESEEYICEKLELWRITMRIQKMHILGHSLGGFYIGLYTLKYPDRIMQAYFVSSAGFSRAVTNNQLH